MTDPGPLASSLWLDNELESSIYLDGIITVVDAKNFEKELNEPKPEGAINEAQRQAAFADILILNKCDLVSQSDLQKLEKRVSQVNAIAPRIYATYSVVPLGEILDIHAFDIRKALQVDPLLNHNNSEDSHARSKTDNNNNHHHNHTGDDCTHESHKTHDSGIHTVWFETDTQTTLELVNQWFAQILWENVAKCEKIFRIKGEIAIIDSEEKYMVQGVHENFEITTSQFYWELGKKRTKIVFIGKGLFVEMIKKTFEDMCHQKA